MVGATLAPLFTACYNGYMAKSGKDRTQEIFPQEHMDALSERTRGALWERWPDEPNLAYLAFEKTLSGPERERVLIDEYRKFMGRKGDDKTIRHVAGHYKAWARDYHWAERWQAYDDWRTRLRYMGDAEGLKRSRARLQARIENMELQLLDASDEMHTKMMEILQKTLTNKNYNMGHAVQMGRFVLEVYKSIWALSEKMKETQDGDIQWTSADDDEAARLLAQNFGDRQSELPAGDESGTPGEIPEDSFDPPTGG